ncbi:MAG: FkbM family methyltransferase [Chthoniobacterales bacterium]
MIEKDGVLVHLDPKGDRIGHSDFVFTGWVAAERPVSAVWLPAAGPARLTTCDRPDVRRVFPNRRTLGFSGQCAEREIGPGGLRIAVQLGDQALEVEHPVPAALPQPPWAQKISSGLQLGWLRWRERMASNSSQRFAHTLQRHLLARQARGGVFQRRHSDALLADFATAVPDALFVQIGANDGFTGDPLNHLIMRPDTRWRGVLVEPVAHLFEQLSARYGNDPALQLERAAIGETDGTTVIHRLQTGPGDSLWLEQIPSLDPGLLQRNAGQFGKADSATVEETVPCLSVATLLERHAIARLDLLVIDTEGWDWRILRQFDLARLPPKLLLYEHQHLSPNDRESAHHFLAQQAYEWVDTEEGDTIAWRPPDSTERVV